MLRMVATAYLVDKVYEMIYIYLFPFWNSSTLPPPPESYMCSLPRGCTMLTLENPPKKHVK